MTKMNTQDLGEKIVKELKSIFDPEIPVDIYELGLIYDVFVNEDNEVKILMTLTSPNCPVAESLPQEVEEKIRLVKKWARDYDSTVEPLARRLDTLQDLVTTKYPKAINYLVRTIETLESYAQVPLQSESLKETHESETKDKS